MDVKLLNLNVTCFDKILKRSVASFSNSHNLFIGENGSGKSTYLKLVEAATNGNFLNLKENDFEIAYSLEFSQAQDDSIFIDFQVSNKRLKERPEDRPKDLSLNVSVSEQARFEFSSNAIFRTSKKGVIAKFVQNGKSADLRDASDNILLLGDPSRGRYLNFFRSLEVHKLSQPGFEEIRLVTGIMSYSFSPSLRIQEGLEDYNNCVPPRALRDLTVAT
jgi:hypothetical protein